MYDLLIANADQVIADLELASAGFEQAGAADPAIPDLPRTRLTADGLT